MFKFETNLFYFQFKKITNKYTDLHKLNNYIFKKSQDISAFYSDKILISVI